MRDNSVGVVYGHNHENRKILLFVALGILALVVIVFAFFLVRDLRQEDILRDEINSYLDKEVGTDDFAVEIKTTGDYAILEKEIKTYFKDVSDTVKRVNFLEEDEEFLNILTPENFQEDGPEFKNTLAKIASVRDELTNIIGKLSNMCTEEYILSLINSYDLDSYYVDLYKELMYSDEDLEEIQGLHEEMTTLEVNFSKFLDDCEAIIQFLRDNSGDWVIENNSLLFRNDDLLAKYQELTDILLNDSNF